MAFIKYYQTPNVRSTDYIFMLQHPMVGAQDYKL